jgi:hypothetical protein
MGWWAAVAFMVAVFALVAATACVVILIRLQRMLLARQQTLEAQAGALHDAVRMIEARLEQVPSSISAETDEGEEAVAAALGDAPAGEILPVIDPEIQVVIAAAAAVAAGPHARVRSARIVKPHEDASPWSQQGRVLVQTSHKLR